MITRIPSFARLGRRALFALSAATLAAALGACGGGGSSDDDARVQATWVAAASNLTAPVLLDLRRKPSTSRIRRCAM